VRGPISDKNPQKEKLQDSNKIIFLYWFSTILINRPLILTKQFAKSELSSQPTHQQFMVCLSRNST
jgi:hypothetical protein